MATKKCYLMFKLCLLLWKSSKFTKSKYKYILKLNLYNNNYQNVNKY